MSDPEQSNPWTTLGSRLVYENPWIAVREDRVIRPDGEPGIYGVVHYKNRAVGVLPVDDEGRVWLVGQYRYPLHGYSWEIPEGGGSQDESAEECRPSRAPRGDRPGGGPHRAGRRRRTCRTRSATSSAYIFRATELVPGASAPEGTERLQVRLVEWSEAWAMLRRGEITDSMSVIALLHEAVRRAEIP